MSLTYETDLNLGQAIFGHAELGRPAAHRAVGRDIQPDAAASRPSALYATMCWPPSKVGCHSHEPGHQHARAVIITLTRPVPTIANPLSIIDNWRQMSPWNGSDSYQNLRIRPAWEADYSAGMGGRYPGIRLAVSNPKHFATACLRWGTPPQARNWLAIPPNDHKNRPYASFFVRLPALAGLASARIAVLREPSNAAYAAMAIVAAAFFGCRFFPDFAGALHSAAVLTVKPVWSCFAFPFAFSPTMVLGWSRNLASCLSPSMTGFPQCDCGTSGQNTTATVPPWSRKLRAASWLWGWAEKVRW